jgi:hypothetical protein
VKRLKKTTALVRDRRSQWLFHGYQVDWRSGEKIGVICRCSGCGQVTKFQTLELAESQTHCIEPKQFWQQEGDWGFGSSGKKRKNNNDIFL